MLQDLGVEQTYEATSVVAGYRAFLRHKPDVVILDLTFDTDDLGGLSLINRIASADKKARILVFSMHDNAAIVSKGDMKGEYLGYAARYQTDVKGNCERASAQFGPKGATLPDIFGPPGSVMTHP